MQRVVMIPACLLLLLLPTEARLRTSVQAAVSLNATAGQRLKAAQVSTCTCDCCLLEKAKSEGSKLSCVPRGGPQAPHTHAGDGGCEALCSRPEDLSLAELESFGKEMDYTMFCNAACRPMGVSTDMLCATLEEAEASAKSLSVASESAETASGKPSEKKVPDGEEIAENLAEVAMLRAERRAREAKQAAALSHYAYEKLKISREKAADAAGQAALEEVIIDTRKDSNEAAKIRTGWEDGARDHAMQKALVAAAPYKTAKLQTLRVAEAWDKSAADYASTGKQYEAYAMRKQLQEKALKKSLETEASAELNEELISAEASAKESVKTADKYIEEARTARKEAAKIRAQSGWDDQAEAAAAAHAMYADLPKGVSPPLLPPLP
mmetsp:Transcript_89197/g.158106  ORF Transcript_89197/g.158106 Transcript_89197/m.158106 type:complete len:381 (+) Transcript_89197:30-1172(+)